MVDSQGFPLAIHVGAAHENNGKTGIECLAQVLNNYEFIQIITSDATYKNAFGKEAKACGISVEISQKPPSEQGFVSQKHRWQVERSFSWLNFVSKIGKRLRKNRRILSGYDPISFYFFNFKQFLTFKFLNILLKLFFIKKILYPFHDYSFFISNLLDLINNFILL